MKFKDTLWKRALGEITLYHTRSGYRVMLDEQTISILWGMCAKTPESLDTKEKNYYEKLSAQGMMEPGEGTVPEERSQSPLAYLDIEVMGKCNLSCKHCYAPNRGGAMEMAMYEDILEHALRLGVIGISLNGGEPLLHPHRVEMITKAISVPFRTELFTNATLVTPEFCRQIAPLGLDKVLVSLDGFRETHEKVRGKGSFEETLRGIRMMKEHGLRIWINSIIHQDNEEDFPRFQKFCLEDIPVNGVRCTPVNLVGSAKENAEMFRPPKTRKEGVSFLPKAHEEGLAKRPGILKCRAAVSSLFITAEGEVYPCSDFRHPDFLLGEISKTPLSRIYENQDPNSLFLHFDERKLISCQGCPALPSCQGGCRARAFWMTGDAYGKDMPSCLRFLPGI